MKANPYESFSCGGLGEIVVKREVPNPLTRKSLANLICAYLNREINSAEMDAHLLEYDECGDPIIEHVVDSMYDYCEGADDRLVCLSKSQWDHVQRLLLLLAADCRIDTHTLTHWSWRQLIAFIAISCFLCCSFVLGWGPHLWFVTIPFGLVSIALRYGYPMEISERSDVHPYREIIYPFASMHDLATAYRSATFQKTRYPRKFGLRDADSTAVNEYRMIHCFVLWLVFSPVILLFQSLPAFETKFSARGV